MSDIDVIVDYSRYNLMSFIGFVRSSIRNIFLINYIFNLSVVAAFSIYFFNSLNMAEKIFTFAISGKVVGTSYILTLRDVYIISGVIVASLLAYSFAKLINEKRSDGKIKLRIENSTPLYLQIKLA